MSRAPATLVEALDRAAALGAESNGLCFVDRREQERHLGWTELRRRALRLAAALAGRGIGRGDRVALLYPTSEEFAVGFFGVSAAGAVPVPIAPPLRLGRMDEYLVQLSTLLAAALPALVLAEPRLAASLADAGLEVPAGGAHTVEDLGAEDNVAVDAARPGPDELALLQFSSGTTSTPKPVALSHRALLAQVRILNDLWPDGEGVRHSGVSWLPLHHDMGLVGFLLSGLWRPAPLALLQPEVFAARPALWLRAIGRHRATISAAPSFAYALCVEKISDEEMEGVDLSSWTIALNGAETVAPATIDSFCRRFARWGFRREAMTPVYGLAEAALALTFSALPTEPRAVAFARLALEQGRARAAAGDEPVLALVGVGRPLPEMAIEIRDPQDPTRRLAPGRVGAVFGRSPSLMDGYFGQPEATRQALRDGWLDTGDRGFLWEGELFLTGRGKDLIIVRGRNIAPETVEQAAARVAGVRPDGVAAVGMAAREGTDGEGVALFVERDRRTAEADAERIAAEVSTAALTAAGILPAETVVLPSGALPRTSSGKVRRQEALRRWRAGTLVRRREKGDRL